MSFKCPRRSEVFDPNGVFKLPEEDHWREDNTCSYCGSLHPDTFMELVNAGVEVTPTDKNYKAYINRPNARAGKRKIVGIASSNQTKEAPWIKIDSELFKALKATGEADTHMLKEGEYVMFGTEQGNEECKFYFQHLDQQQQQNFIAMYNEKSMILKYPGYFYTLPFFCKRNAK